MKNLIKASGYIFLSLIGGKHWCKDSVFLTQRRRLYSIVMHLTWGRFLNLLCCLMERRFHKIRVQSYPYIAVIDPANYCNLKCPLCASASGDRKLYDVPKGYLKSDKFSEMLNSLPPSICRIILYNWGEPLLNPEIFDIIQIASRKNIGVELSSNLMEFTPEMADKLIDSGLERLVLSIDGASQKTYSQYRVGGDFDRIVKNIKILLAHKKKRGSFYPIIEWQFIPMSHNEDEVEKARTLAQKLGVDIFAIIPFDILSYLTDYKGAIDKARPFFPKNEKYKTTISFNSKEQPELFKTIDCRFLYETTTLNWDGNMFYCCPFSTKRDYFLGNVFHQQFKNLWNCRQLVIARKLLKDRKNGKGEKGEIEDEKIPCYYCLSSKNTAMS